MGKMTGPWQTFIFYYCRWAGEHPIRLPITYLSYIYPSAFIYKPSWKDEFTLLQWRLDGESPSTFGLVATQVLVIFEFSRQESLEEMGVLMTSKYVDQELRWKS